MWMYGVPVIGFAGPSNQLGLTLTKDNQLTWYTIRQLRLITIRDHRVLVNIQRNTDVD